MNIIAQFYIFLPTVQLVEQTLGLARKYGIQAVRYERGQDLDEKFLSGQSVMVATYAALFNGLTRFGIAGGTRELVRLEGLILDDAHTAFGDMRDAFTITESAEKGYLLTSSPLVGDLVFCPPPKQTLYRSL